MTPETAELERDELRRMVLEALDKWAQRRFSNSEYVKSRTQAGATDADLPRLFKALDVQFDVLLERFGVTIQPETRDQAIKHLGID